MARQDPWLSERMRADARIRRGERNIYQAVITAMTIWLDTTRQLILGQPVPALTAAADDPIPDIDAAQASFAAWARALENHVEPAIAEAFGEAFAAQSRAADISPVHFQEHHMATVHDRLKIWPEGAFEELRPELLEAMQQNESIEQITDRIGRILDIDAPSRRIRADISAIDAQIADPTTDRDELPFLRGKRRRLWNQHDESQQQWKWLARRIARTEIQGAVEGGSLASAQATAEATGEEMYKAWLCVTGDTPVSAVGVTHASRRHYEGPAVRIRTASGATVSLTPEHRVLTGRGWIPAKLVNEKDHLLHVVSTDPAIAPDVQEVPATIGEVVDAFMATEPVEVWSMPTGVDLDSELVYSQVEVVRPDRDLANSLHPRVGEFSEDLVFADADLLAELMLLGDRSSLDGTSGFDLASVLHRDSETARRFDRIRFVGDTDLSGLGHVAQSNSGLIQDAPDGRLGTGQCGCDVPCGSSSSVKPDSLRGEIASSPLFLSGLSCSSDVDRLHGAEFAGFRAGSSFTHGSDFASDGVHAASNVVGDRLTGLAGSVAADDVVNVELYTFSGHVYDLSTTGEWYACDGLIIHNCTSDDRTRASHNVADGQIVKLAEPFRVGVALLPHPAFPGGPAHEVINCVVGSTEVEWPGQGVSDATRRSYRGTFIHLRTARGHVLTITPNHPVLTPAGYVAAGDLRPGQQILATRPSHAPEVRNMPTSIEQIHTALRETRMQQRMVGSAVDFHGDGIEGNEVEVVRPDSDLRIERNFTESSGGEELQLVPLEHRTSSLSRVSSLDVARRDSASLSGGSSFPSSSVRGGSELPPLLWGEALHPNAHRFASGSDRKPEFVKPSGDDGSTDAELVRHLFHAVAVGMSPCEVIEVERFTGNHDVFNLSTTDEWYIGNGIALHNCRCSMRVLTYSEMQAELQGMWGGRGVLPMGARLGPDDEADAATAIDRLNRERRGEVLDPIERTEPEIQDTVNVDDDVQENPEPLEPDDEPFTTPHDDIPDLEDDIPDDELHVADEEPNLDTDDEELPDHPAVEGDPTDDSDNETEPDDDQPDPDPADIPEVEEEPEPEVIERPTGGPTPEDAEALAEQFDQDFAEPINQLSDEERAAVLRWQGMDRFYRDIQNYVRSNVQNEEAMLVADLLEDAIMAGALQHDVVMYRGIRNVSSLIRRTNSDLERYIGQTIETPGFLAASTSREQATSGFTRPFIGGGPVLFELTIRAGTPALWVAGAGDPAMADQRELLLGTAYSLLILGVDYSGSVPTVQAEVI